MTTTQTSRYQPPSSRIEPTTGTISNVGRVRRVLKLIAYMNEWRNLKEIAAHIAVTQKTVHRYISLLAEVGFLVEQRRRHRVTYRVTNTAAFFGIMG